MADVILFCQDASYCNWTVKLHKPHGNVPNAQRHVHITRKNLCGVYSWNIDGTRHDKHKFPTNEKWIKKARKIASEQLRVPESALQFLIGITGPEKISLTFSAEIMQQRTIFNRYVRSSESIFVFANELGLVLCFTELEGLD
jgi:hypothetical protein